MDPKKTAVVLIEYQNDFTSKGGTLHDAVKGVMEKNSMLQNTVETVKKAREAGCTIVFAPIMFVEGYGSSATSLTASSRAWWTANPSAREAGAPRSWMC